jgi:hypothetical protein
MRALPIARATPGWGLTAISQGLELREGAADDAALLIAQDRNLRVQILAARTSKTLAWRVEP